MPVNCDDLAREVYCILGIPIDAIEMPAALRSIEAAAERADAFVLSTPNLNFLVNSQTDAEFRESLLMSDLCPPDGAPIIWIARLLGVPIKKRTAGSDIFEALKIRPRSGNPLKVFLFGATKQIAAAAAEKLNNHATGLQCLPHCVASKQPSLAAVPFVLSTPNLNFLVNSQTDAEFRESLLMSDLCPPDGAPIIWIARLLGIPIKKRTAGSDIFEALKAQPRFGQPLKVFLFGATEQTAAAAARKLNDHAAGLKCVGWTCPGFGSLEELSQDQFIDQINASDADLLVVALGATKGTVVVTTKRSPPENSGSSPLGSSNQFSGGDGEASSSCLEEIGS